MLYEISGQLNTDSSRGEWQCLNHNNHGQEWKPNQKHRYDALENTFPNSECEHKQVNMEMKQQLYTENVAAFPS